MSPPTSSPAQSDRIADLIARVRNSDDAIRGPAWQSAATCGASAVKPLAQVMVEPDIEIARCAKRALWLIVRQAGRPGAAQVKRDVQRELIALLSNPALVVRREALWMLSEIGNDQAVPAMAKLLSDPQAREDARCTLLRFPGAASLRAIKHAFAAAPADFKPALADSLRQRGETIAGYPSQKLVPGKQTTVTPAK
jgi:HEAT repeat protein